MHSLQIPFYSIAVAFSLAATVSAASSQSQNPPSKTAGSTQHKVTKGETMWSIAQKHQTSVGEIIAHNKLQSHIVREGMTLKIPSREAVKPITSTTPSTPRPSREAVHVVKSGETFWTIADRYKISPQALVQANPHISANRLQPDMEINVPPAQIASSAQKTIPSTTLKPSSSPTPSQPAVASKGEHILEPGETFYSISKKRGIKLADLVAANPSLKPERLKPGTKINIPGYSNDNTNPNKPVSVAAAPAPKPVTPAAPANTSVTSTAPTKRHTVIEGDSIASIAERYAISTDSLLKQNHLTDSDSIYIGDVLTIPTTSSGSSASTAPKTASVKPPVSKPEPAPASSPAPAPTPTPEPAATMASVSNTANSNSPAPETAAPAPQPVNVEAAATNPIPPPKPKLHAPLLVAEDGSIRSYIVSHGETDETICEAFGITKKELYEHNKLSQGTQLRPGDEIMIPATTKTVVSR